MELIKKFMVIGFVLLTSVQVDAQSFELTDSTFEKGDVLSKMIVFSFSGSNTYILNESIPFMDSLINFLKKHVTLHVEVGNYIDQRGDDEFNRKITQTRAQVVVDYLVDNGIKADRLTAVGYGEANPLYTR